MNFTKAEKRKAKLRAAVFGPSGAGKTMSALRIAAGIAKAIGGKVALIDTERGSASKYADRFAFDALDLTAHRIDGDEGYIAAIEAAGEAGYDVLIIDSLSHGWQELLEEIDHLAKAKYRGNTWSAWSEGMPKQKRLVNAIVGYPGHLIATMRSKTEWTTSDEGGKKTPRRVGLAPEQGKGIEYEFDLLLEINTDHMAQVIKDRTGKFQDSTLDKPSEKFGASLVAWLSEGAEPVNAGPPKTHRVVIAGKEYSTAGVGKETLTRINAAVAAYDKQHGKGAAKDALSELHHVGSTLDLTEEMGADYVTYLTSRTDDAGQSQAVA